MNDNEEAALSWILKAGNDLLNADNNLRAEEIPYDTVCFHAQQAAEKIFKAVLAYHNQEIPRIHDLVVLLERISLLVPGSAVMQDNAIALMPFSVTVRYPAEIWEPSAKEAVEARECAGKIAQWFRTNCPPPFDKIYG